MLATIGTFLAAFLGAFAGTAFAGWLGERARRNWRREVLAATDDVEADGWRTINFDRSGGRVLSDRIYGTSRGPR